MLPLRDINPVRTRPVVTNALIVANVVVFVHQLMLAEPASEAFALQYGAVPALLTAPGGLGHLYSLATSMFLHGGVFHLLSNLWFLRIFGDNVEESMGRGRFLAFYLVCGVFAAAAHVFVESGSPFPLVGASGAISGVLGAYFRLFPRARLVALLFFIVRELPAVVFIVLWFGLQLALGLGSLASSSQEGGVAFFAHIGGFVCGLLLIGGFGRPGARVHGYQGVDRGPFRYHGYDRFGE